MKIINLKMLDQTRRMQAGHLLVDGFKDAWETQAEAMAEIQEALGDERICLAALDEDQQVIGWLGAIRRYDGHAWEMHPLVVREDQRRKGVGSALVAELEKQVRSLGGLIIYLGTDDEHGQTSLSGVDLYANIYGKLASVSNLDGQHPFTFYQKLGYTIMGVVPDANGDGKPDILMAKRL